MFRSWLLPINVPLVSVTVVGLSVSFYALYVEIRKHRNPKFIAACDINEYMKCSRVLTSEYSRGLGLTKYLFGEKSFLNVPNCVTGIAFYTLQLIFGHVNIYFRYEILLLTNCISCLVSVYLACVLLFVLKDLCIVCASTYVVNFILLYINYYRIH